MPPDFICQPNHGVPVVAAMICGVTFRLMNDLAVPELFDHPDREVIGSVAATAILVGPTVGLADHLISPECQFDVTGTTSRILDAPAQVLLMVNLKVAEITVMFGGKAVNGKKM